MFKKIAGFLLLIVSVFLILAWFYIMIFIGACVWPWNVLVLIEPLFPLLLFLVGIRLLLRNSIEKIFLKMVVFYFVAVGIGAGIWTYNYFFKNESTKIHSFEIKRL